MENLRLIKEMSVYGSVSPCIICHKACLHAFKFEKAFDGRTPRKFSMSGKYAGQWLPYLYSDRKTGPDAELTKLKLNYGIIICKICEKRHFDMVPDEIHLTTRAVPKTDKGKKVDSLRIVK